MFSSAGATRHPGLNNTQTASGRGGKVPIFAAVREHWAAPDKPNDPLGGYMSHKAKLLAVLSLSLALSSGALAQGTLKIGAPQPMTGPDAPFGDKFQKAYSMAAEEINAKGGINGRKIEVIIEDHQA